MLVAGNAFLQLDDTGSTGTIHRPARVEKIYKIHICKRIHPFTCPGICLNSLI